MIVSNPYKVASKYVLPISPQSTLTDIHFITNGDKWESGAELSAAQSAPKEEAHLCKWEKRYLPLEGLVDTLRPICMSITPTENPISALRLSGAVALNIAGKQSIESRLFLLQVRVMSPHVSLFWMI